MKLHSLLMCDDMVVATLQGNKQQTRRVPSCRTMLVDGSCWTKKRFALLDFKAKDITLDAGPSPAGNAGPYLHVPMPRDGTRHRVYPVWSVGDRIWIKECFAPHPEHPRVRVAYRATLSSYGLDGGWATPPADSGSLGAINIDRNIHVRNYGGKWTPSIFMTQWYSRILLEVTDVRIQHLRDITAEDARAEGLALANPQPADDSAIYCRNYLTGVEWMRLHGDAPYHRALKDPRESYYTLWDSLNSDRGFSSDANPWVIALTFKVLHQPSEL